MAMTTAAPELAARDAMIAWYRGEFAAANAIIDALCGHLVHISSGGSEYEAVLAAVHRRRINWIPVLQMQKYFSIADVSSELRRVAAARETSAATSSEKEAAEEEVDEVRVSLPVEVAEEESTGDSLDRKAEEESSEDSPDRKASEEDEGSQGEHTLLENVQICSNHEDCTVRLDRIKTMKGFVAKESVKGHMVNVVKGLKVYEDMFTDSELLRLGKFINELRLAGRNGDLSGETFIYFNKQMKGNKREIIQLGAPLFQPTSEEATSNIEPIPPVLQAVIDHFVQWHLIPESRKPNSCIINFFDEGEHSQPYFKPPHLDNPISTLLLSETTMAFGRALISDHNGNYKGPLTLVLKEGSLLVMRGNSADMARHVVCPSESKRVSITFIKVRDSTNIHPSPTNAMTVWQSGTSPLPNSGVIGYGAHAVIPAAWGMTLRAPVLMLAPARPIVEGHSRRTTHNGGTGVFLPWKVGPKKYTKHLPPRIQRRKLLSLPSPLKACG
ncbi:RNA demethylase ALKBH10B-like [Typha angustifolia]|uniref:RNA demethylase ALKBH10B-like n=1 Tax=Typha angustifolia TaxID=59011 RepID=UPI003C2F5027